MKKILAFITALIMVSSLISCGEKDTTPGINVENHIEYDARVDQVIDLGIFDTEDKFGNEGTLKQYTEVVDVDVSRFAIGGQSYEIFYGGCYRIFGTSDNGQIYVNAPDEDVVLILDNLNLTYKGNEPVIFAEKCKSVTIVLANENTVADSSTNLKKGAIYVKSCGLTLDGTGTLNVTGNFKSGIFNTKGLVVNGGKYNINAKYHGIYGEQKLTINGGKFNIVSGKSGLKSGDYDETVPLEAIAGSVVINSGSITVDATSNGISSYGSVEINGGRMMIKSLSDGIDATDNIVLNGATVILDAKSDGIKSDKNVVIAGNVNIKLNTENDGISAADVSVSTNGVVYIKTAAAYKEDASLGSYILVNEKYYKVDPADYPGKTMYSVVNSCKGIKAIGTITVSEGNIGVDCAEDAFKADKIIFEGGKVVVSTNEDCADAATSVTVSGVTIIDVLNANKGLKAQTVTVNNGKMTVATVSDAIESSAVTVNGGTLYLFEAVDTGEGSFTVNGGTVISISTENDPNVPTAGTQKYFSAQISDKNHYVYGNYVRIAGDKTDVVLKLPKKYSPKLSVVVSSSDIDAGEYKIEVGTYEGGKISSLECTEGKFTSKSSYTVNVE